MLVARGVSVSLSERPVLSDISVSVAPGEIVAVVGPNGAGKSTLLRILTGDLQPRCGEVFLDDRPLADWPRRVLARRRGVLAQSSDVAFPFTVFEVVALGRVSGALTRSGRLTALVLDCLAAVDLAGYEGRLYQHLSGGEQQRVQVARMLCQIGGIEDAAPEGAPRWLLLDEPTQSLDIAHQLSILDVARSIAGSGGGVLAILHDLNLASLYADRIVLLNAGRIVGQGSPTEVLTGERVQSVFGKRVAVVTQGSPVRRYVLPLS
jgi:iron complex transport system ATP-binding protein